MGIDFIDPPCRKLFFIHLSPSIFFVFQNFSPKNFKVNFKKNSTENRFILRKFQKTLRLKMTKKNFPKGEPIQLIPIFVLKIHYFKSYEDSRVRTRQNL